MRTQRSGFSLIEVIIVLAILFVLGTIGLKFGMAFFEAHKQERAAVDLIIIQHALEEYKARFGDYPRELGDYGDLSAAQYLFNALNGKFLPDGTSVKQKAFLNNASLELSSQVYPDPSNSTPVNNSILDPWGNSYIYRYRGATDNKSWKVFGYVLYSTGEDGLDGGIGTDGKIDKSLGSNIDNIYAL